MSRIYSIVVFLAALLMAIPAAARDKIPPDTQVTNADCPVKKVNTPQFEASLWPVRLSPGHEWVAFRLQITNKSNSPLTLDWENSRYVDNNKEKGGLKFENEPFGKEAGKREAETIPPGGTLSRVVWPASRFYDGGGDEGWFIMPMAAGEGEQGISIALKNGTENVNENLALNINNQVKICGLVPGRPGK